MVVLLSVQAGQLHARGETPIIMEDSNDTINLLEHAKDMQNATLPVHGQVH